MDFDDFNLNYEVKCIDESNNSKDRWKNIFIQRIKDKFEEKI